MRSAYGEAPRFVDELNPAYCAYCDQAAVHYLIEFDNRNKIE